MVASVDLRLDFAGGRGNGGNARAVIAEGVLSTKRQRCTGTVAAILQSFWVEQGEDLDIIFFEQARLDRVENVTWRRIVSDPAS